MASSGELLRDIFMSLFCSMRGYLVSDRTPGFVPWSGHLDVSVLEEDESVALATYFLASWRTRKSDFRTVVDW